MWPRRLEWPEAPACGTRHAGEQTTAVQHDQPFVAFVVFGAKLGKMVMSSTKRHTALAYSGRFLPLARHALLQQKKKTKPHRLLVSVSSVSRLTFPPFAFCLFLSCLNASKAWSCHGSDAPGLDSRALEGIVRGPRAIQGLAFWWRASAPSAFGNKAAGRAPARPNERQD